MAYSDVIIRQCGPRDADSDNDLRILWRMLKMMKTGFIRYLLAIIFMSAALSVFDMITALLFKNIIFRVENYAQRNMFAGLLKEVLLCAGIGCLMLFIYALSFYVYTMEAKKGALIYKRPYIPNVCDYRILIMNRRAAASSCQR